MSPQRPSGRHRVAEPAPRHRSPLGSRFTWLVGGAAAALVAVSSTGSGVAAVGPSIWLDPADAESAVPSVDRGAAQVEGAAAPRPVPDEQASAGQPLPVGADSIPVTAVEAYTRAADSAPESCHLDWTLLAAIGEVESDHGRAGDAVLRLDGVSAPRIIGPALDGTHHRRVVDDTDDGRLDRDTEHDHAVGPMQFIPSTWAEYAADGDGNGRRNPFDLDDAAPAAARLLCSAGDDLATVDGLSDAVLAYDHRTSYLIRVLALASIYASDRGEEPAEQPPAPEPPVVPPPTPKPPTSKPPAKPASQDGIWIGTVHGGYAQAVAGTGVDLAEHAYAFFSSPVPDAEMISVSAAGTPWREVAAARPGSVLYSQIVRWAQTIKARGHSVMVAYNHEPEGRDRFTLGSPSDFIAAFRHVESIFDAQGATNVVWTWQMTAYAFSVGPDKAQAAARWYPGDEWVDNVGADAYNWYTCGEGSGRYAELQEVADPVLAFARAHGKQASFPEFASHSTASRPQWIANAHQYLVRNRDVVTAAFYFNWQTVDKASGCKWGLSTATEYAAVRRIAEDTTYFRS